MKSIRGILISAVVLISFSANARERFLPVNPADVAARLCTKAFSGEAFVFESVFSGEFIDEMGPVVLGDLLNSLSDTFGTCEKSQIVPKSRFRTKHGDHKEARAKFTSDRGKQLVVDFGYDDDGFVTELAVVGNIR